MPFYLFENITQETCKSFFEWVESKERDNEILICSDGGNCAITYGIIDWINVNKEVYIPKAPPKCVVRTRPFGKHESISDEWQVSCKENISKKIYTTVTGYAHSGALLILSSGTKGCRKAYKHSTFMLHQPILEIDGNVSKLTTDLISLENDYDIYCEILAENTDKTALEIKNLIDSAPNNEITLNAQQALEFGIIDEIIGE